MGKYVHNLDIYAHTDGGSCVGCILQDEGEEGADAGAGAAGAGPAADSGAAAAAAGPAPTQAAPPADAPAAAPPEPALGQEHLIEVQLRNAAGAPAPRLQWQLTLPDGSRRDGTTTADGFIRLSVTPQTGAVTLDLPEFARSTPPAADGAGAAGGAPGALAFVPGLQLQIGVPAVVQLPPRVFRGRLTGMLFDTDRAFLLPGAMHGIRRLKHFYDDHPGLEVLVVGHTDLRGTPDYNLGLSDERARSIAAFLQDQFDVWLAFYAGGAPPNRRWGIREDQHMLSALTDGTTPFYTGPINGANDAATQAAVRRFQEWSNANRGTSLTLDGIGPNTRRELIKVYMQQDGTSLPTGTVIATHGCGEFHPEVPVDGDVQANRRVEIFLFEGPIDPPVPARCPNGGCTEQPLWVARTLETIDFGDDLGDLTVRVTDAGGNALAGVAVSLTGPAAANDDTDARGNADFHNLAPGSYALAGRLDGFAHEPTAATVVGGRGANAVLVMHPVTIEILDAAGNVATSVKMGLWDNAFTAAGALLNAADEPNNFAGADTRRFAFRVRDVGVTTGHADIDWRTLGSLRGDLDRRAPAPNLTLVETAAGSHVFVSRGVLLTSDNDDGVQGTNSGLAAPLPDVGVRNRGQTNHRLRHAVVDGFVRGEYVPSSGGNPVRVELPVFERAPDERRRVPVQIFVLRVAAGGAAVLPTAAGSAIWTTDVRVIRETYARLGVHFETTLAAVPAGATQVTVDGMSLLEVDPPAGVNPLSVTLADEATIGTQYPAAGASTARVFFTGGLARGVRGEAWTDVDFAGLPQQGGVFVDGPARTPYTMAHEVGHLLTNKAIAGSGGHYAAPAAPAGNHFFNNQNLMRNGTSPAEGVDQSKRLWDVVDNDGVVNQFTAVRGSPYTRAF
jgi:outer membrane protein OmpA-like peptidoglycan-associated protein